MQPNRYDDHSISDHSIILTAMICIAVLVLVVGIATLWHVFTADPPVPFVETISEDSFQQIVNTVFEEGFSMVLPAGFSRESRQETEQGYVVYRYRSEEGFRFTIAIIANESSDRHSKLPQNYSQALVKGVKELDQEVDGEVQSVRVMVDGMPAEVFRFYERETYRGVTFTYLMVAIDRERKLVLKFSGKYGRYSEEEEDISMPEHWYESLMTLRHVRP